MSDHSDQTRPTLDHIREFVLAGHGDLPKVQSMLADCPALLNAAHEWGPSDTETATQAAAHVGNVPIAEFMLAQGAPLEICTAAMLGRIPDVEQLLRDDPESIHATGAHGIPLLTHAAFSGKLALVELLVQRGAQAGVTSALHGAVSSGHEAITRWFLENARPDLSWQNFRGLTALAVARQRQDETIVQLLQAHGASE